MKKKSLGQIAREAFWRNESWVEIGTYKIGWDRAANAVAKEIRKRDLEKQQWISVEDRLPTKKDADCNDNVWVLWSQEITTMHYAVVARIKYPDIKHWMPTGLRKPQPPKGQK